MRAKLMTSAAVLAGVLAFATVTQAQTTSSGPNGGVGGNTNATDSYNSTDLDVGIADSLNDNSNNSTNLGVNDSLNDNSNNSTNTDLDVGISDSLNDNSNNSTNTDLDLGVSDSFNDNSTNVADSGNDNSTNTDNSTDLAVDIADSFNDNSDNSTNTDNSTHTNLDLAVDIADSFNDNSDNSTHVGITDSFNDNSTWRVSLSNQSLAANVSDLSFDLSEGGDGPQNGRIRSGDINQNGGAFAGFAGIQTVSNITGQASVGQAATAVAANANITFGNGG
ncbi:hypothetical protein [uncultured Brevundimonas sp.]|uniref:hypothetical protein n=1 Tax=Brevundimonas sp. CEF1 TaxID=3442642 RepID=UPI000F9FAA5B|nr:hypothetical protein [uncultured Brevundimonas sp.]